MTTIREALRHALIRTVTPFVVGFVVVVLVRLGIDIDNATATAAITTALGTIYYAVVKVLESRWPSIGRLLGRALPPLYPDTIDARETSITSAPNVSTGAPAIIPRPVPPAASPAYPDEPAVDATSDQAG